MERAANENLMVFQKICLPKDSCRVYTSRDEFRSHTKGRRDCQRREMSSRYEKEVTRVVDPNVVVDVPIRDGCKAVKVVGL